MSERFPGGFITRTPPVPTTSSASGVWTTEQAMEYQKAGTWPYGGPFTYVEDVFSTYLYTGNGTTQTINNGIDLSGNGGMTWIKGRSIATSNQIFDTVRGAGTNLQSDNTSQESNNMSSLSSFNSNGFSLGTVLNVNWSTYTFSSWTFRKQPKFFDVQTWTGNGAANRLITHALGAIPAVIMIKATSTTGSWYVSIRSSGLNGDTTDFANVGLGLESTSARDSSFLGTSQATAWTSTQFTLYATGARTNVNGVTYVAYIFAHNAGGFGLTGTDNVISCGAWTATGGGVADVINLGFEPQWILWKRANSTGGNWYISDNMRGMPVQGSSGTGQKLLYPNLSDAEYGDYGIDPTSTGFNALYGATGNQFIYIAIRRGPMKVPTSGTSVFLPTTYTGPALGTTSTVTTGWPVDSIWCGAKNYSGSVKTLIQDRLRIANNTTTSNTLQTTSTGIETALNTFATFNIANNTGYTINDTNGSWNGDSSSGFNPYAWVFRRAPSFFDEVCYTGTGVARTLSHNLAAVPEIMIVKNRAGVTRDWAVYTAPTAATNFMYLNATDASGASNTMWNDTTPTSSVFTVGTNVRTNSNTQTYIAYLFATCAGVSKVGSYTGNGSSQTIACGFTAGARFILIKRTNTTGDWYVWDTARGIVAGNDPHLSLNTTVAEVTTNDTIDTDNSGFIVNQLAATNVNVTSATYIFLAIA